MFLRASVGSLPFLVADEQGFYPTGARLPQPLKVESRDRLGAVVASRLSANASFSIFES